MVKECIKVPELYPWQLQGESDFFSAARPLFYTLEEDHNYSSDSTSAQAFSFRLLHTMSGSTEALSKPSVMFMRHVSRTNTRVPPIARRSSSPMPCRMAMMSRDKLQKETAAKSPDLRRCLGHQRLFRRSIEVAHEDMRKTMASFRLDDCDEEFDDDFYETPFSPIREQITNAVKAIVKRRASSQPRPVNSHPPSEEPVRMIRVSSKSNDSLNTPLSSPSTHDLTIHRTSSAPSLPSRGRRYASKLGFARRLWSPSVQAIAS